MTIEEKINKIEKVSSEIDNCSISDGLKKYEESAELVKECISELNQYKGKITVLTSEIGKMKEENFNN